MRDTASIAAVPARIAPQLTQPGEGSRIEQGVPGRRCVRAGCVAVDRVLHLAPPQSVCGAGACSFRAPRAHRQCSSVSDSVAPLAVVSVASPQTSENDTFSVLPVLVPLLNVVPTLPLVGKQHPASP